MIYRFVIVSDETPDFRRDIRIEGTSTFLQLHKAILDAVGYADDAPTIFQLTDHEWRTTHEVYLFDMGGLKSDEEIYLMDQTPLDELLEEERQKLLYVFDLVGDRKFFIELREITYGASIRVPEVVKSKGEAPVQHTDPMEMLKNLEPAPEAKKKKASTTDDEIIGDEFGSDEFSLDEIDEEGFGFEDEDTL